MRTGLALLMLVATGYPAAAQSPGSIYQRPIGAQAVITGSPRLRDGTFQLVGTAASCGVIPKEISATGETAFVIQTVDDTKGSMTTITFGALRLDGRTAGVTEFRLSIGVMTSDGGRPPLYVLNTDPRTAGNDGNDGTATLSIAKGVSALHVAGHNDAKEITCVLAALA